MHRRRKRYPSKAKYKKSLKICKGLIERILPGKKVKELRFVSSDDEGDTYDGKYIATEQPETEKKISVGMEAKSVQLDVLFEGEEEWYNLEMYDEVLIWKNNFDRQQILLTEQNVKLTEQNAAIESERKLTAVLLQENRMEDLKKMLEDDEFRQKLIEELL